MIDPPLDEKAAFYEGEARWSDALRLAVRVCHCAEAPSSALVTSVRCVVFKGAKVIVIDDSVTSHIMPGGRIEPGETIDRTLERELLEECGWTVREPRPFAMIHFRHLTPRPDGYRYPYPDFMQLLFVGEADTYRRSALKRDGEIETGSRLTPISRALVSLSAEQQAILRAAIEARSR